MTIRHFSWRQAACEGAGRLPRKSRPEFLKALIAKMHEKYKIDAGRIFMQGMSAGNLMTAQFCRYYGNILAGAAGSGGPTQLDMLFTDDGAIKNAAGPLPVWQASRRRTERLRAAPTVSRY